MNCHAISAHGRSALALSHPVSRPPAVHREYLLLQTNGTGGRWVSRPLGKVRLDAGSYRLSFEYVRAAMQVRGLAFARVSE